MTHIYPTLPAFIENGLQLLSTPPTDEKNCSCCHEAYADEPHSAIIKTRLCNHVFHYRCLMEWLHGMHKTSCPCCRRRLYGGVSAGDGAGDGAVGGAAGGAAGGARGVPVFVFASEESDDEDEDEDEDLNELLRGVAGMERNFEMIEGEIIDEWMRVAHAMERNVEVNEAGAGEIVGGVDEAGVSEDEVGEDEVGEGEVGEDEVGENEVDEEDGSDDEEDEEFLEAGSYGEEED